MQSLAVWTLNFHNAKLHITKHKQIDNMMEISPVTYVYVISASKTYDVTQTLEFMKRAPHQEHKVGPGILHIHLNDGQNISRNPNSQS